MEQYAAPHQAPAEGEIESGQVVTVTDIGVVVNLGGKTEGLIPAQEFAELDGPFPLQPGQPVEVVNYRVEAIGLVPRVDLARLEPARTPVDSACTGTRRAYFASLSDQAINVPVYAREHLRAGQRAGRQDHHRDHRAWPRHGSRDCLRAQFTSSCASATSQSNRP